MSQWFGTLEAVVFPTIDSRPSFKLQRTRAKVFERVEAFFKEEKGKGETLIRVRVEVVGRQAAPVEMTLGAGHWRCSEDQDGGRIMHR